MEQNKKQLVLLSETRLCKRMEQNAAVGSGSQASGTHGPLDLGEATKKNKKPAEKGF